MPLQPTTANTYLGKGNANANKNPAKKLYNEPNSALIEKYGIAIVESRNKLKLMFVTFNKSHIIFYLTIYEGDNLLCLPSKHC